MKTSCSTFESVARRRRAVAAGSGSVCPAPLSRREGRRGEGILICPTEYCQSAHCPRMLQEGARSVHGPCLVGGSFDLSDMWRARDAGGFELRFNFDRLVGLRSDARYAVRVATHGRPHAQLPLARRNCQDDRTAAGTGPKSASAQLERPVHAQHSGRAVPATGPVPGTADAAIPDTRDL